MDGKLPLANPVRADQRARALAKVWPIVSLSKHGKSLWTPSPVRNVKSFGGNADVQRTLVDHVQKVHGRMALVLAPIRLAPLAQPFDGRGAAGPYSLWRLSLLARWL